MQFIFSMLLSERICQLQRYNSLITTHVPVCGIGATPYSNAYFGHGNGSILLDNVGCTGRETRLLDCQNYGGVGLYSLNCGHDDDAGVRCNGKFPT